jgi:REP element-mobilizing transposase RayT
MFRLRPSAFTNAVIRYALAVAMRKTGVLVHAICVMSNHYHLVATDEEAMLPVFMREFHRAIAKALNAHQGQRENLWSVEPYSAVELLSEEEILEKIAYVATNPVAAGLVASPTEWPGVRLWFPTKQQAARPASYFGKRQAAVASFAITIPSSVADPDTWVARIKQAIQGRVAKLMAMLRRRGVRPIGRDAIRNQSIFQRPATTEPSKRFVPAFAGATAEGLRRAYDRLKAFRADYRVCRERWTKGEREVIFPAGTWWMRVFHKVATHLEAPLPITCRSA